MKRFYYFILIGMFVLSFSENIYANNLCASWYSRESLIKEGTWKNGKERRMANGKKFNENNHTCATRLYPIGSILVITNIATGDRCVVEVTDRIGRRFAKKRIDLSRMAFSCLADLDTGIIKVKVEPIIITKRKNVTASRVSGKQYVPPKVKDKRSIKK
ncbi:MAG: septal ring lytic transglycosylase RlpA family protein [Candidatus Omnitrophota bacterium]